MWKCELQQRCGICPRGLLIQVLIHACRAPAILHIHPDTCHGGSLFRVRPSLPINSRRHSYDLQHLQSVQKMALNTKTCACSLPPQTERFSLSLKSHRKAGTCSILVLGKFGPRPIGTRSGPDQTPQSRSRSGIFPKIPDRSVSSLGILILPETVSDPVWTRTA